jgi:hypothetical protein
MDKFQIATTTILVPGGLGHHIPLTLVLLLSQFVMNNIYSSRLQSSPQKI